MHKSRTLLTVALTSIALVAVAVPAAAHEGDGDMHRGKVGRHAFTDTEFKPGARCVYRAAAPVPAVDEVDTGRELVGVVARPPKVAATNRTDRRDRQPVAWRFVLQEKVADGEWTKVKRSRTQVRRAIDSRAARFTRLAVRYDGDPEAEYRVKTKAFWLSKRNPLRKVGAATHLVNYYKVAGEVTKSTCPGGIPAPEAP
jgi:hypothetical protein